MNPNTKTTSRITSRRTALAASVAVVIAAASAVHADDSTSKPTLVRWITSPLDAASPLVKLTDACVAAITGKDYTQAKRACDGAVREARYERVTLSPYASGDASSDLAVAYSNRAVLHYLLGNTQQAQQDFNAAQHASPNEAFVAQNRSLVEKTLALRLASE
jgi:hypothetical protein